MGAAFTTDIDKELCVRVYNIRKPLGFLSMPSTVPRVPPLG